MAVPVNGAGAGERWRRHLLVVRRRGVTVPVNDSAGGMTGSGGDDVSERRGPVNGSGVCE
jgi:hypothetical protein